MKVVPLLGLKRKELAKHSVIPDVHDDEHTVVHEYLGVDPWHAAISSYIGLNELNIIR
jgi:hypothetical protein